jgi:LL-diaminopimelate aminotransferase
MIPDYSKNLASIPPYPFAKSEEMIRVKQKKGEKVLDFSVGDPDLPTPSFIMEALKDATGDDHYRGYSNSAGELWFREAVAEWYRKRFDVNLDPATEVCALIGSKEGLVNISRAFLNPGDKVLHPDPGYPVYANGATLLFGAIPIPYEPVGITDWDPDGVKLVFLNYPHNPTGTVMRGEVLHELTKSTSKAGALVCYDNAYSEVTFGEHKAPSILQIDVEKKCSIEFHSCSKTFSMTGLRIGFAVGNAKAIAGLKLAKSQVDSGPPKLVQLAAKVALDSYVGSSRPKEVESMVNTYRKRMEILVCGLRELGFDVRPPAGTFYLWHRVAIPSSQFTEVLLNYGIAVTPGVVFGPRGEGYVRWSVTQPEPLIREALEMMKRIPLELMWPK